jgi:hypothetical protein
VTSAAVGVFGSLLCAVTLAVVPHSSGAWRHAGLIAVGGVLVQVVAGLTGTGLGLLLRPAFVACAATIVLPIGCYLALGPVGSVRPWATQYAGVHHLLSGQMTAPGGRTAWVVSVAQTLQRADATT